jgi:hypothetical protein
VWSRAKDKANQSEAKTKIVFHNTNATPNNMHVWIKKLRYHPRVIALTNPSR